MSDPALALQAALVKVLKASGGVGTADRVYDSVPERPVFPYVTVGDDQVIGDDDDCGEASEVIVRIHAWSRKQGYPETKAIAAAIRTRLRTAALTLNGFVVDLVEFQQARFLKDSDGETRHGVLEFRFLITHTQEESP